MALAAGAPGSPGYLGAADPFSVLAGSTATNTGAPTHVWGDVGVSPGTAIVGFQTSQVGGAQHGADSAAGNAQNSLTTAYGAAAGATPSDSVDHATIGNQTFVPGVYHASSTMDLTGTVTLDGGSDANATWVFQAGSTLTTASSSRVVVINGNPCNVYWQVGSSATLGSATSFIGSVLANTSITAVAGATVDGRLLARSGAVTLDSNQITQPACSLTDQNGATITAPTPTPTATATPTPTATATATPTASPSSTPSPSTSATPKTPATRSTPVPTAGTGSGSGSGSGSGTAPKPGHSRSPDTTTATIPTSTATPATSGSGGGGSSTGTSGRLATTGSDVGAPLALAGGLLGLGFVLVAAPAVLRARRRSAARGR